MFAFYSGYFDTVELNNSFYHLPKIETFASWRENSPRKFRFAVKGSRFITHMKKLKDPEPSIERFFVAAEHLEEKLATVLFQLPPHWKLNRERLEEFLEALPQHHRYAFEFREESWLVPEVFELLRRYNAAFCIHDLGGIQSPVEITANFTYIRFHGPGEAKYQGSYSDNALKKWAEQIQEWRASLKSIFIYFNNDIGGWAIKNALRLKELTTL